MVPLWKKLRKSSQALIPRFDTLEEKVQAYNLKPDAYVAGVLISEAWRYHGNLDLAFRIFDRLLLHTSKPGSTVFRSLVDGCRTYLDYERLFPLLPKMDEYNAAFDRLFFAWFTQACFERDHLPTAKLLLQKMRNNKLNFRITAVEGCHLIRVLQKYDRNPSALEDSFDVLKYLDSHNIQPNHLCYALLLILCGNLGAFEQGKRLHRRMVHLNVMIDLELKRALFYLYSKCGAYEEASVMFDEMNTRNEGDLFVWNTAIATNVDRGFYKEAIDMLERMQTFRDNPLPLPHMPLLKGTDRTLSRYVRPNEETLATLLQAHSRIVGHANEAIQLFHSMNDHFSVKPSAIHCRHVVDALAREDRLEEAERFARSFTPQNRILWEPIIRAYRRRGLLDRADLIDRISRGESLTEIVGRTWIEINGESYVFVDGDRDHKRSNEIHEELRKLMEYTNVRSDTNDAAPKMKNNQGQTIPVHHSEKLAISFGLIVSPPEKNQRILLVKDPEICDDCHTALKRIAKLKQREILARDRNWLHHIDKNGKCSCQDFF